MMNRYLGISGKIVQVKHELNVSIYHILIIMGNVSVFAVPATISELMSKTLYVRHISSVCWVLDWLENIPS